MCANFFDFRMPYDYFGFFPDVFLNLPYLQLKRNGIYCYKQNETTTENGISLMQILQFIIRFEDSPNHGKNCILQ